MALGAQVVDLARLDLVDQLGERHRIGEVAVVGEETDARLMRVLVEVVDAVGVEARRAPHDAVHLVALLHQELGQVGAVLPRDAGHERLLRVVHVARGCQLGSSSHAGRSPTSTARAWCVPPQSASSAGRVRTQPAREAPARRPLRHSAIGAADIDLARGHQQHGHTGERSKMRLHSSFVNSVSIRWNRCMSASSGASSSRSWRTQSSLGEDAREPLHRGLGVVRDHQLPRGSHPLQPALERRAARPVRGEPIHAAGVEQLADPPRPRLQLGVLVGRALPLLAGRR